MDNGVLKAVLNEESEILKNLKNRLFDLAYELDDVHPLYVELNNVAKLVAVASAELRVISEKIVE